MSGTVEKLFPLGQLYTVLRFLHHHSSPTKKTWDFTDGPAVKILPFDVGGVDSVPGRELRFHVTQGQKLKTCNRSNAVANSTDFKNGLH